MCRQLPGPWWVRCGVGCVGCAVLSVLSVLTVLTVQCSLWMAGGRCGAVLTAATQLGSLHCGASRAQHSESD